MADQPSLYRFHLEDLCEILYRVGYNEEVGLQHLLNLIQRIESFGLSESVSLMNLLTLFPIEKVKETLLKVINKLPKDRKIEFGSFKLTLVCEYLKANGLEAEASRVRELLEAGKIEEG